MTAEVAILNRSGVAIAADSAVTIGGERVWMSSNKIFSLGPNHDIAMMVYGSGDFTGVPWELVIQAFREQASSRDYPLLADAVEDFKNFLRIDRWRDASYEQLATAHFIASQIEFINLGLSYDDDAAFQKEFSTEAKRLSDQLEDHEIVLNGLTEAEFRDELSELIKQFTKEICGYDLGDSASDQVHRFVFEAFRRGGVSSGFETGVVFLGYGRDQIFPAMIEHILDGRFDDELRIWLSRTLDINDRKLRDGSIVSFAQTDMTALFVEGILEQYSSFYENVLETMLEEKTSYLLETYVHDGDERLVEAALESKQNQAIMAEFRTAFHALKQQEIINPLVDSIRALPKEEMMAMAEAFVELTSMRRKVDSNLQTVGGPVDVAFISKSDGFTWAKRKLYFDRAINGDFFDRRLKRLGRP